MENVRNLLDQHDLRLVLLAIMICCMACLTTVSLNARVTATSGRSRLAWLVASALLFGFGVWSLHFVAMLAFMPGYAISYALVPTALSILAACSGAMIAFTIWHLARSAVIGILAGGTMLGLSIATMHVMGVVAMRGCGIISFDKPTICMALLSDVLFAMLALWRMRGPSLPRRLEAAFWLACAICVLHFTAMSALRFSSKPKMVTSELEAGSVLLALFVSIPSVAILVAFFALALLDKHMSLRTLQEIARLRQLSDATQEGLLIHRHGIIREINRALCERLGITPESVIGAPIASALGAQAAARLTREHHDPNQAIIIDANCRSGEAIPMEVTIRAITFDGEESEIIAMRDLSTQRRDEARIRYFAHHDPLTGLLNRFSLRRHLSEALAATRPSDTHIGLLFLDLDRFKAVNDLLGHAAGDALLVEIAERLAEAVGPTDIIARLGGDEFVILLKNIPDERPIVACAQAIQVSMTPPIVIDGRQIDIDVSMGGAIHPRDGLDADTLLRNADAALYAAKAEGRNRYRLFDAVLHLRLQRRMHLQSDMISAMKNGDMTLHYQPLLNCVSGRLEGYEALLRWYHPEYGAVSPMEFIPIAEETDAILLLGDFVLREACRQLETWPRSQRVAVNISPMQFRLDDLPDRVAQILRAHALEPHRLELEITEATLIQNPEKAGETIHALRKIGVKIALDDFGTGYSSLNYLHRFPVDRIKIDRSFTNDLEQDNARAIVRAIIALGHNLNIDVTAEGVETPDQLSFLRDNCCDQVQGFLLGRPEPLYPASKIDVSRKEMETLTDASGLT
ncbi:PAS domain-containing protein [Neoasaia chiangmaiensis NBRC 101099]|uniref:Uncharacterized protein n=1 Tax=Neoasaia chiangmaiensis TaxID=320497 RepID=A0A1U9KN32_9PROT|nr:EAL domain-containing protein [Neoasaia chiangmaiensis]AQS87202.1 hypothetical protein A0U93_03770 [Neoasaia chiangmaiensis]GBR38334.1 PAS domain-containing protein [Neoasaia chiangmaiensis NBRC 101099]GEN15945.1 bifunctional diguanylate cyclase/phosphodiesterase [Neoasaia chiangmaiensis]